MDQFFERADRLKAEKLKQCGPTYLEQIRGSRSIRKETTGSAGASEGPHPSERLENFRDD